MQPCRDPRSPIKRRQRLEGTEKRLLHSVLSIVLIRQKWPSDRQHPSAMIAGQRLKRRLIAGTQCRQQFGIGRVDLVSDEFRTIHTANLQLGIAIGNERSIPRGMNVLGADGFISRTTP